ncbi:MAG: hypothetical protein JW850_19185 [Thermoflexales bacterium]|nr:hypothetical protein [Thermoflexales bacterium]
MDRKLFNIVMIVTLLLALVPAGSQAGPVEPPDLAPAAPAATLAPTAPGEYWENYPDPVKELGTELGEADIRGVGSMVVYRGEVYVGTDDAGTAGDGAEILGSSDGASYSPRRYQIAGIPAATASAVYAMAEYDGYLYAMVSCPNCAVPLVAGATNNHVAIYRSQTGGLGTWNPINDLFGGQPTFSNDIDTVRAMLVWEDELWVFGSDEDGLGKPEVQHYNGSAWTAENISFFDSSNHGIRSAAVFQGNLYVGTSFTGVSGTQVWRRVPGTAPDVWTKLAEDGFGLTGTSSWHNIDASAMYVYKHALYVGTRNTFTGAELYRTYDGINWTRLFGAGLGEPSNIAVRSMVEANGSLYLSMEAPAGRQLRVFRTVDGEEWSPVALPGVGDLDNRSGNVLVVFQNPTARHLYVGTHNDTAEGAQVWRVKLPTHEELWIQRVGILRGNANFDATVDPAVPFNENEEVTTFAQYQGSLYVGVNNEENAGGFVYRTTDGVHWTQVGARGIDDLQSDGDGIIPANRINAMLVAAGRLFIATGAHLGTLGDTTDDLARVFALNPDGNSWARIGGRDFGTASNIQATALAYFDSKLWVGTENTTDPKGAQVCYFPTPATDDNTSTCQGATPGWPDASNTRISAMEVFTPTGTSTPRLYVGTRRDSGGAQLLYRTTSAWCTFETDCPTTSGFNTANPVIVEVSALKTFNGYLYVGTRRMASTFPVPVIEDPGGAVYRSNTGSKDFTQHQVSRGGFSRDETPQNTDGYNQAVTAFAIFRDYLYAGTEKPNCNLGGAADCIDFGGEVWRTDGTALDSNQTNFPGYLKWDQVGTEGFGFFQNFRVSALYTYKHSLFAGTRNETPVKVNYTGFERTGGEVWRTDIPNQHIDDPCAEPVYVALRTRAAALLKVDNEVPRFLPRAGIYQVPLRYGPRTYQLRLEYTDRSVSRNETIEVTTYADGSVDVTHPVVAKPNPATPDERWWRERTEGGLLDAPNNPEIAIRTMEIYTPTSGSKYLVVGTEDAVDGAGVFRSSGSSGFSPASGFYRGLGTGANDPNTVVVNDFLVYPTGNYMLAATRRTAAPARLYFSTDLGNWARADETAPSGINVNSWATLALYRNNVWVGGDDTTNANRAEMYEVSVVGSNFGWSVRTPPNLDQRQRGFVSSIVFKGYLYAGTRTDEDNLGAQIWRFSQASHTWELVAQGGIANPDNAAISAMAIHNGVLYVGTTNRNDGGGDGYPNGAELYASSDGVNFEQLWGGGLTTWQNDSVRTLHSTDGYLYAGLRNTTGNGGEVHRSANGRLWSPDIVRGFAVAAPTNTSIEALLSFNGNDGRFLFAGTARTAAAQVWRTPLVPPLEEWQQVVDDGWWWGIREIHAIEEYDGELYIGTPGGGFFPNEARMYKTISGTHWVDVGASNIRTGEAFVNRRVDSIEVHKGKLYIGTRVDATSGGRIYRLSDNGNEWTRVGAVGAYIVGDVHNEAITALYDWNGTLYIGTENNDGTGAKLYRYDREEADSFTNVPIPGFTTPNTRIAYITSYGGYLFFSTRNTAGSPAGGEIWYSADGTNWSPATEDGFSDPDNVEILSLVAFESAGGSHLYALTENAVDGTKLYRSADGRTNWTQVNRPGFARSSGSQDADNAAAPHAAVFDGFLYVGTANAVSGAEIFRTDGSADGSDPLVPNLRYWDQVNADGFGEPENYSAYRMMPHGDYLYATTRNSGGGTQIWRARKTSKAVDADDKFGRNLGIGFRVTQMTTMTVTPGDETHYVPSLGTYEIWVGNQGSWNIALAPGCGNVLQVNVDSMPVDFDEFRFATIASPQRINRAFPVTLTATLSNGVPAAPFTGTVSIERVDGGLLGIDGGAVSTGGTVLFSNQYRRVFSVTIPISETGIVLRASMAGGAITGLSNAFNVRPMPVYDHLTINPIGSQSVDVPFAITVGAIDNEGSPFPITGEVLLADSTTTISPTSTSFANQSSKTFNVTIGVSQTNVVINASYSSKTANSNPFNVTTGPVLHHFTIDTVSSPQTLNQAFNITIHAVGSDDNPYPFSGVVTLNDTTGTITPTQATFNNQSSLVVPVTIRATRNNVVISVDYLGKTGQSNAFDVTAAAALNHFGFATIASPQAQGVPFQVTLTAYSSADNSTPFTVTDSVILEDSTGTIAPTTIAFSNQSQRSFPVSIGAAGTNVVITASLAAKFGVSNAFDVNVSYQIYMPTVLKNQ